MKNQVKHTLEKAQKNKQHFETGNRKLKDFIQKIRDFLMGVVIQIWCDRPSAEGGRPQLDWFFSLVVLSRGGSRPSQH